MPPAGAVPPPAASPGGLPDRDALSLAFGDAIVPTLKGLAKAIYSNGHFVSVTDRGAVFALENEATRQRAEKYRTDVEAALGAHFGTPVPLVLIDRLDADEHAPGAPPPGGADGGPSTAPRDGGGAPVRGAGRATGAQDRARNDRPASDADDDEDAAIIDLDELEDAVDVETSGLEKLTKAFPGAVLVEGGEGSS